MCRTVNKGHRIRGFTHGADDFFVALVPDEENLVPLVREPPRLLVDLGHKWTRRIDRPQISGRCLLMNGRSHSVGAEDNESTLGNLVSFVYEYGPTLLKRFNDVLVVDDLFSHVYRRTVNFQGLLNGFHCSVDTSAVPARGGEQHTLDWNL
jgi:hypothetical protein